MTDTFESQRKRLFGLAYRMLGSRAEAEDLVQDAWLRWQAAPQDALRSGEAWLVTVVTRMAIDRLRLAQRERESYVGPWLPEPLVEASPEDSLALQGEVSLAFLLMLERLAPEERAIFLLVEVFDFDYVEVAAIVGKSEAACRQSVSRARARVRQEQPRFSVAADDHRRLLAQFVAATQAGDRHSFASLFSPEAQYTGDGGAETLQARRVVRGADRIGRLYEGLMRKLGAGLRYEPVWVNGQPGLLQYLDGELDGVIAIDVEAGRIGAMYMVRNRAKLPRG